MTRPKKYFTEEDRIKVFKKQKNAYMMRKEWYCDVCNNNKNYTLAGKTQHINTSKHQNKLGNCTPKHCMIPNK